MKPIQPHKKWPISAPLTGQRTQYTHPNAKDIGASRLLKEVRPFKRCSLPWGDKENRASAAGAPLPPCGKPRFPKIAPSVGPLAVQGSHTSQRAEPRPPAPPIKAGGLRTQKKQKTLAPPSAQAPAVAPKPMFNEKGKEKGSWLGRPGLSASRFRSLTSRLIPSGSAGWGALQTRTVRNGAPQTRPCPAPPRQ